MAYPVKFSKFEFSIYRNAPLLGEHTFEIMKKIGYTKEQYDLFKTEKII